MRKVFFFFSFKKTLFRKVQSAAGGAERWKTRNKAFSRLWKPGEADPKQKKKPLAQTMYSTIYNYISPRKASSFFFSLCFHLICLYVFGPTKEYIKIIIILHADLVKGNASREARGGSITVLGLATDAKVAQFSAPSCVSADDLPLPATRACHPLPSRCRSSSPLG